ncbi:Uncharacterised protein [Vibrio cholerae]|nr:Uncharacterised protein [Vibrio cholerae]CSI56875.1 Uncharacterised protein [Vibrio cholerae]
MAASLAAHAHRAVCWGGIGDRGNVTATADL